MKRTRQIARTSIIDMIDFLMAPTGVTRHQAAIAIETVIHFIRNHQLTGFPKHSPVSMNDGIDISSN